jgi:glycolate oxidase
MFNADEIDCLKRIRAAFDPAQLSNPGKMFPGDAADAAPGGSGHGLHPLERAGVISRT